MPELGKNRSPETGTLRISDVAILTMAAATVVVLVENGTNVANRLVLQRINGATTGFLWIVPLYYGLVFGALATALMVITRLLRRPRAISLVVLASVSLASFTLLILGLYGTVHQWALAVFAVGLGVQAGRIAATRGEQLLGWSRRLLVLAAPLILLPALVNPPLQRWLERREISHLTNARVGAPNILLIILDTVRARSLSLYGHNRRTTPGLERLATSAVVFDHAYSVAPWTLPAHATMFTGVYPHRLNTNWTTPLEREPRTLAEALRAAGYHTGGFVANLLYTQEESGLARGFIHYEDFLHTPGQLRRATILGQFLDTWRRSLKPARPTSARKPARLVSQQFLDWVDQVEGRPFFAFLNYLDAHQPYLAAPQDFARFQSNNRLADRYEAAIASLDAEVERLVDSLERRGLLRNTILIITSDHGEQLGEHGLEGHGNSLYLPNLHVPLLVRFDGRLSKGTRILTRVSLRDLPRTVADLVDLEHDFPGTSLVPLLTGEPAVTSPPSPIFAYVRKGIRLEQHEPVSRGDMKSLIAGNLELIVNGDGREELYDIVRDPLEDRAIALTSVEALGVDSLRRAIRELLHSSRSNRP